MRRALCSATLIVASFSFSVAQITPTNQGTAPSPGSTPEAQDPARPQNQMPPDGKAPAPTPSAKNPPVSTAAQTQSVQNQAVQNQESQNGSTPSSAALTSAQPHYLMAGTDVRAALDTPLSTKTSKAGDRFTATVTAPVHDSSGNVIVPVGSKLNGQVGEPTDNSKLATAIKDMGHLNLRFTDIQLPNGADVPISATLLSVHNTKAGRGTAAGPQTGHTAIGSNAGMAGTFGPPMKGLAVGNAAGGGYVLATSAKQVDLPAECGLRLKVDRNTPLP